MTRLFLALFLLGSALLPACASAAALVADLSNYRIDIDAGFRGTRIFLFGARNDNGDIVVVVRGPEKNYTVRRKEPIAGIWVNTQQMKFKDVPDFYMIASSRPLERIDSPELFRELRIGHQAVLNAPHAPEDMESFRIFSQAFFRHQAQRRLYQPQPVEVGFMGETLFKTHIDFPDTIPKGDYTAEIYLISDGELVGAQITPVRVAKSGFDALIYDYAHQTPLLYGIGAVLFAVGIGWGVGRLFEQF